jgi:hypothetical protein
MSQDNEEFKKQTSHWLDSNIDAPRPNISFTSSAPVASGSTLRVDKGKGSEVAPPPEAQGSTAQDAKGKAKGNSLSDLSPEHPLADDLSLGAAAQRRLAGIGNTGPLQGDIPGGSAGGNDHLSGLLDTGHDRDLNGRTSGSSGTSANGLVLGNMGI